MANDEVGDREQQSVSPRTKQSMAPRKRAEARPVIDRSTRANKPAMNASSAVTARRGRSSAATGRFVAGLPRSPVNAWAGQFPY